MFCDFLFLTFKHKYYGRNYSHAQDERYDDRRRYFTLACQTRRYSRKRDYFLAEVETDKAVMELESYEDGTILYIGVENGQSVPVDNILAIIDEEGEAYEHSTSRK